MRTSVSPQSSISRRAGAAVSLSSDTGISEYRRRSRSYTSRDHGWRSGSSRAHRPCAGLPWRHLRIEFSSRRIRCRDSCAAWSRSIRSRRIRSSGLDAGASSCCLTSASCRRPMPRFVETSDAIGSRADGDGLMFATPPRTISGYRNWPSSPANSGTSTHHLRGRAGRSARGIWRSFGRAIP